MSRMLPIIINNDAFELYKIKAVEKISDILAEIQSVIKTLPRTKVNQGPSIFQTNKSEKLIPMLKNIQNCLSLPDNMLIYSLYLIDKYTSSNNYFITSTNAYRLLAIGVIIADKFLNDENICFQMYSRITRIPVQELKKMELLVLDGLGYNTYIKETDFENYLERLSEIDSESSNSTEDDSD